MSPAPTRCSSRSMSRSTRAVPVMPGRVLALRESSADIFMARFCPGPADSRWRRAVTLASEGISSHTCHTLWQQLVGSSRRVVAILLGRIEQFAGVRPAAVGFAQTGQHAGEFRDAIVIVEA